MINSSGFLNECSNNEGLWVLGFDLHLICALGEATQRALEKRKRERERFGSLMTENLLLGHLLLQPLLVDEMRCFFSFLEKEMMNLSLVLKRQLFAAVVVDEILVVFSRDEDDGSEPQIISHGCWMRNSLLFLLLVVVVKTEDELVPYFYPCRELLVLKETARVQMHFNSSSYILEAVMITFCWMNLML